MLAIPELAFPEGSPTHTTHTTARSKGAQANGSQRTHPILPLDSPGSWQDSQGQGQFSQLAGHPTPCPESPRPMLALLKKEESKVSAPSTASSSRKLG